MNQGLHRVIFNAARGLRMVVAETAISTSKGGSVATGGVRTSGWRTAVFAIGWTALAAMATLGLAPEAHAQIVPNPFAAAGQKPQVLVAPNGVPLVNITTPSAAGVSINQYNQFDVNAAGAILNNSRGTASTQLGGLVQGNPWLATGPARIIVNQVSSSNPSYLNGYIEVAGQRAEVIIANPSGIQANGAGFINTSRATLTTGTPQYGAIGTLDSFLVQGGTITVDGKGLDLSTTDYAAILSRALQLNAAIYASDLKVVTGANQISDDHAQVTHVAGTGNAPTFALDVSALGGMYAKKITLIGTEAGLGVRNAGNIGASAGNLVVTAAGRLENTGTLEGQSVQLSSTGSDIDNRGGTIRQTSTASLAIAVPTLSNANGGWIGTEPLATGSGAGTGTTGSTGGTGTTSTGTTGSTGTGTTTGSGSTGTTPTGAPATPPDPGSITAAGAILNDGGKIYAGGPINLQSPNIVNTGGTLSVANMALNQQSFSNHGGTLNVSGNFSANVDSFDNSTGTVRAGNLNIATTGDLINVDGTLTSDTTATLSVGGKVDNTRGTIAATNTLAANVTGATDNTAGTLAANQGVQLATASLTNDKGAIQASAGPVQLTVTGALNNGQGSIGAGTDLSIQAGSLANASGGSLRATHDVQVAASGALTNAGSITAGHDTTFSAGSVQSTTGSVLGAGIQADGSLASAGELNVTAANALAANGTNLAADNASLQGASVDVGSGTTSAANIALTATSGNVTTSGAKVVTPGTLAITANSNAGQILVNNAGTLNAAQLQINASNIANTNGGEIVQTGTATTSLAVSGTLNNDGGRIASNSEDLTLSGASITNAGGRIEHAGTGTLAISGGSFSGTNGQITGNGALAVSLSGTFAQDGGTTTAQQITVDAGALSNRVGEIIQTSSEATRITVVGAADNTGGSIASNGNTTVAAGSLTNQGGTIRAAGTSNVAVSTSGLLDNSNKGEIGAGGNTTVNAGSLNNDAGRITAVGDLTASVAGAASNQGGTLAANGNTTISAASLNNNGGTTAAVNGALAVTTSGATTNAGGTLQAGGATTLSNAGLDNSSGKVFGDSVAVDTHGQQLANSQGTIAATTTVYLQTGTLLNDAGLIQSGGPLTIDTHGQQLANTNAAGYANGQGGITSADTLSIATGNLNNAGGFIGAKGAITANTQQFSNTAGGQVFSQDAVTVATNGGTYDNSGGQTQALGNLTVSGAGVNNTGGLLRSSATTTLNVGGGTVLNNNTQAANQGIEGESVAITVGGLNNTQGAIRANQNVTATVSGTVDNTNGLMSAGDTLKVADPNADNPGAKTLNVINTGGTLVADKSVVLDAAKFSADGTLVSNKDLTVALTQDIVNNAEVVANGNLSYGTTGNLSNNGKLLAGQTLTVSGNVVTNSATGEMSGTNTTVNAGTLNNRGLIDSNGETQFNAGVVNNIGTGRIYGDQISIGASQVNNIAETIGASTSAATIAARKSLDIGASEVNNKDHSLIFSSGDLFIGGALDGDRYAVGKGATLNNFSATIESLGSMSIAMGSINNFDTHMQIGKVHTQTDTPILELVTLDGKKWSPTDTKGDIATRLVYHTNADGSVSIVGKGWSDWYTTISGDTDVATATDPARIVSGGDMTLNGNVTNRDSKIIAGGTLTANSVNNRATQGQQVITTSGIIVGWNPNKPGGGPEQPLIVAPVTTTSTVAVGAYEYVDHVNATAGYAMGSAGVGSANGNVAGTGSVSGSKNTGTIVEVAAKVGEVVQSKSSTAGTAEGASSNGNGGASTTVPMVVRTSTPSPNVPQASLFGVHPGSGRYLVVTDPRFAGYRQWLSSDYLLNNLGLNPDTTLQRLGDGFYEQQLIREQIAQLTGYRYLDGFSNDEKQYTALMNAGLTFAQQFGLTPGVALTAAQMAQLTSDIVWLVEQTVTLPDGSTQRVLVPQVYVRVRPGDIDGSGALLSGARVNIDGKGSNLTNTGTIAGREIVTINANTVDNLNGRISGGQVGIKAQLDINNIGGVIDARDRLSLEAGRDVNVITTVAQGTGGNSTIDRVAGLYVSGPGGILAVTAGRDANFFGATVANTGPGAITSIKAGNDINLGTVQTSTKTSAMSSAASMSTSTTQELGTTITTNGSTVLNAGHDLNARQVTIDSGSGLLSVQAGHDINIADGQRTASGSYSAQWTDKGTFSSTSNKLSGDFDSSTSVGSKLSAGVVSLGAKNDINIVGSSISGSEGVAIAAGRNLTIVEGRNTSDVSVQLDKEKRGISGGGVLVGLATVGVPMILPSGKSTSTGVEIQSDTASASTITSSNGGVLLQGNNNVFLQGVQIDAGKNVNIQGGNVVVQAATNSQTVTGTTSSKSAWYDFGSAAILSDVGKGIKGREATSTEVTSTSLSRTTINGANVNITAADTLALAGTTINTPGRVTLTADTLVMGSQTVEQTTRTTSQGRDMVYQVSRDNGRTDQTTNYNQINAAGLTVNANQVQAGIGARDSLEQLAQQPGMGWVSQLNNDPALQGRINWQQVEEAHRQWDHDQQGLTPEGAAILTLVTVYFTGPWAQGVGEAAGSSLGAANAVTMADGTLFLGSGLSTSGAIIAGATTAGITALTSQAAVALVNNQFDLGATLETLGSSASVRQLLTAVVTGGVLGGLNMDPIGLPTASAGAQPFFTQLQQNLTAGAARAVISTAINGGSLEDALSNAIRGAILDTVAAQTANAIGNLASDQQLNEFSRAVAHAIAGCAVGAARSDSSASCAAGAIGAVVGELAATAYGRQGDTVQFAAMISGLAVAIAGGTADEITLGSQAGANSAANNYLNHDDAARLRQLVSACSAQCTPAQRDQLATLLAQDQATTQSLNACAGVRTSACDSVRADYLAAANSFLPNDNDIWNWARTQSDASGGKYSAAELYDAYRTSFIAGAVPNMSLGDLTAAADWARSRIAGDGTAANPGEPPLSTIAMGWAVGNYASAQGALGAATVTLAAAIRTGGLAAGAITASPPQTSGGTANAASQTSGGTANAASGSLLGRMLASEEQLGVVMSGKGTPIAGAGAFEPLRDSPRLAAEYGGKASDWSKVRSESYTASDGSKIEIHAYQNAVTGKVVEPKSIVVRAR